MNKRPTLEGFIAWKKSKLVKRCFPGETGLAWEDRLAWTYLCYFFNHANLTAYWCCVREDRCNRFRKQECWGKRTKKEQELLKKIQSMVRTFGKYQQFYVPRRRNRIKLVLEDLQ